MIILRSLMPAALAAALVMPVGALAQQSVQPSGGAPAAGATAYPGAGEHHRGGGWMREVRKLNLSSQQQSQIRQLMQNFRAAHPRGSEPDPQARQQLHAQILRVLTPQQQAQLKADMQQMRAQWRSSPSPQQP